MKIHERVKKASWARGGERREGGRIDYGGRGGGRLWRERGGRLGLEGKKKTRGKLQIFFTRAVL